MFNKLIKTFVNYLENKIEIYRIQIQEEAAKAFTLIVLILIFSMIGLLFVLFLSLFLSEALNRVLEKDYYGNLIVSGLYVFLGVIVYLNRKKIRDKITDMIYSPDEENKTDNQ